MKKTIILLALLGTVLLTGCNQQSSSDMTNSTDASSVNIQTTETETEVSTVKPTEKGTEAPTEDLSMYPTTLDNVDMKEVTSNLLTWCKEKENIFTKENGFSNVSLSKEFLSYDKMNIKNNAFGIIVFCEYCGQNCYCIIELAGQESSGYNCSLPEDCFGPSVIIDNHKLIWYDDEMYQDPAIITFVMPYTSDYHYQNTDFTSLESVMNTIEHLRDSYAEESNMHPIQDFEVVFADKIDL